jgi:hypothetical protein
MLASYLCYAHPGCEPQDRCQNQVILTERLFGIKAKIGPLLTVLESGHVNRWDCAYRFVPSVRILSLP